MFFSLEKVFRLPTVIGRYWGNDYFKEFIIFGSTTIFLAAGKFTANIVAAKLIGPLGWGQWQVMNLILVYSSLLHLGVLNGMNREVPVYKGRKDAVRIKKIQSTAFSFIVLVGGGSAVGSLIVALMWPNREMVPSLVFLSGLVGVNHLLVYFYMRCKSEARFNLFSFQQVILSVAYLTVVIPLTYWWHLPGYVAGQGVATLLIVTFLSSRLKGNSLSKIDPSEFKHLLRVGGPILLVGLGFTCVTTVDRWVIGLYLGTEQLGYYSLALMVLSVLFMLPNVVSQQVYPRMAEVWGRTAQILEVWKWAKLQGVFSLVVLLPIVVATYFLFPRFIQVYMPEYLPGLPAVYPVLLAPVVLALSGGVGNFLNTLGFQSLVLGMQVLCVVVTIAFDVAFVEAGYGLVGVAWGTTLSFAFYALALIVCGKRVVRRKQVLSVGS